MMGPVKCGENNSSLLDDKVQITQRDRSCFVGKHDFGRIQTINAEERDNPAFAVIEYDKNGQIVYEDYSKLNEILHNVISNNIKEMNINNPLTGQKEFTKTISGNILTKLKLSEKEMEYAIKYLSMKNILVRGTDSSLDGEFDGYQYTSTYKTLTLLPAFTKEENTELFRKLKQLKSELSIVTDKIKRNQLEKEMYEIRDSLIQGNMRFVDYMLYKHLPSTISNMDREDMQQIGYEVLINFIDKYDVDNGYALSTGLSNYLMYHVWKKYNDTKMIQIPAKMQDRIKKVMNAKEKIESFLGRNATVEEIAMELQLSVKTVEEMLTINERQNLESIENLQLINSDSEQFYDYPLEEEEETDQFITTSSDTLPELIVMDNKLKENIEQIFVTLTKKEADILKLGLGFYDGKAHTVSEISNILGMTRAEILYFENKALRKLGNYILRTKDFYTENDIEERYGINNHRNK